MIRNLENQQLNVKRNFHGSSTTGIEPKGYMTHGDNDSPIMSDLIGMPDPLNRVVIQSELMSNHEMLVERLTRLQKRLSKVTEWIQPLRTRRDYTSVGRKTFLVEQLPDGALPIYDKDPEVTAYIQ